MEASEPGFGAYSGDRYDYRLFQLLIRSPYRAKYSTMFLIIFFMEKSPFGVQLRPAARPPGHILRCCDLQTQICGHVLAVQSEMLSQCLENLLHG